MKGASPRFRNLKIFETEPILFLWMDLISSIISKTTKPMGTLKSLKNERISVLLAHLASIAPFLDLLAFLQNNRLEFGNFSTSLTNTA